jgi:hypothetical protein
MQPLVFPVGEIPSLIEALKAVPDFRSRHGRRYPLYAILALGIAAMLCGYNSYGAMVEWGKNYGKALATVLGFKDGKTPSVGTLFTVFSRVDKEALLAVLTAWCEQVLVASGQLVGQPVALCVDGKTLRGTRKQAALETHVLSAVSQHLGLTVGQRAMTSKESEIGAMQELLCGLVLSGRVVTMDALLTQKKIARQIVTKGGSL